MNVDASMISSYKSGIGAFGQSCVHWDVAQLELFAIQAISDVIQDWMFNYKGIIIEGDNYNIIKFLQDSLRKMETLKDGQWIEDLLFLKNVKGGM
ncbi:hypothetical protein M5K25_020976 [Dendrobium thyrsiflorum]|uniref:RNase H type-1 domain-containing protein n=1 Tax=Dendrobium thyrsiflorum TaxID=117978 RepID=A0ABD0UIM6_DENTH